VAHYKSSMKAISIATDQNNWYFMHLLSPGGHTVAQLVEAQAGRLRVWFPMVSLEFFIDITLSVALWPWGRLSLLPGG
jgi:hypothetical protein